MSNEHHSLSGRWTAARGMSNSTAPDGRPSGGAVRGRMPLDVKTIFKTGDGRESESLDEARLHGASGHEAARTDRVLRVRQGSHAFRRTVP